MSDWLGVLKVARDKNWCCSLCLLFTPKSSCVSGSPSLWRRQLHSESSAPKNKSPTSTKVRTRVLPCMVKSLSPPPPRMKWANFHSFRLHVYTHQLRNTHNFAKLWECVWSTYWRYRGNCVSQVLCYMWLFVSRTTIWGPAASEQWSALSWHSVQSTLSPWHHCSMLTSLAFFLSLLSFLFSFLLFIPLCHFLSLFSSFLSTPSLALSLPPFLFLFLFTLVPLLSVCCIIRV